MTFISGHAKSDSAKSGNDGLGAKGNTNLSDHDGTLRGPAQTLSAALTPRDVVPQGASWLSASNTNTGHNAVGASVNLTGNSGAVMPSFERHADNWQAHNWSVLRH
ncbi:MAG: hypothetical protein HC829_03410 [Bacteroidales bacterium]|nr:hypothetical protein [Bacteroidales bacterium]